MAASFAWGIDVGNRALKAVKLVRDGDQVRVDDFELIEHETVLSNAGDNKESLIQTALAGFVQRHPMKGGVAGVGVSGQSSFARFIKLPPVEPKKIPEIVRFEAIQQIPFPLDDVEWSYQLFSNPESPDVEVGIFAMRKELVNQHIGFFTDVDLNVQVVQMNPLAVYNALHHDGRFEQGTTMVIDLGAENTDLLIADNDTIWMRSIPIGGNNFTETLVKAFKLNFTKAEELKRNSATSKYARQIFQAMRPVFADLVAEIQRSIGFYSSVHRDSRIKKVLALGGTFKLPGLQKYLQQNLAMDVERLDSIAAGAPTDPKLVPTFNENLLSVVSAYGLALQAMGETKITSSLLPAKIRREKMWKEKTKWFGAAAALFCIGTGLAGGKYLFDNFRFNQAHSEHAPSINSVKSQATNLDSQWSQIENVGGPESEQFKKIANLGAYRTLWHDLLVDIYGALPAGQKKLDASKPDEIKKTPRQQRKIVLIDQVRSRYVSNLGQLVNDPKFADHHGSDNPAMAGGMQPGAQPGAPPAEGTDPAAAGPPPQNAALAKPDSAGFIVTLRCTSPFAQAVDPQNLVDKDFIGQLLNIKPSDGRKQMEYAVVRAGITSAGKVKQNQSRLQQLQAQYQAALRARQMAEQLQNRGTGGARPPGTPVQPTNQWDPNVAAAPPGQPGATGVDPEAYKDPTLEESVLEDWEFTIVLAVMLDPPTYTPAPPAEGQPAGQQAAASP